MDQKRARLEQQTDRELDCLLAAILYRHDDQPMVVNDEYLYRLLSPYEIESNKDLIEPYKIPDDDIIQLHLDFSYAKDRPVPHYTTTWNGFGEALERIFFWDFNVELYHSADTQILPRAVVSQRGDEQATRAEASHHDLRRALVVAAILVMGDALRHV